MGHPFIHRQLCGGTKINMISFNTYHAFRPKAFLKICLLFALLLASLVALLLALLVVHFGITIFPSK